MKKNAPFLLPFASYCALFENAPGSKMFRTVWGMVEGKRKDLTQCGEFSCAYFVSAVLMIAQEAFSARLLQSMHITVEGTLRDMAHCGWRRIARPRKGAVVVWVARERHRHVGFVAGKGEAISNDSQRGVIARHPLTFGMRGTSAYRKAESYWWHSALGEASLNKK